ncbi:hypothetical protein MPH_04616, partial [Macrophomina phaseolina MS6]
MIADRWLISAVPSAPPAPQFFFYRRM